MTQPYQHGPPLDFVTVANRMADVAHSIPEAEGTPTVVVEVCTRDPYSVTRAVVTAVGYVDGNVLLTVEPVPDRMPARSS